MHSEGAIARLMAAIILFTRLTRGAASQPSTPPEQNSKDATDAVDVATNGRRRGEWSFGLWAGKAAQAVKASVALSPSVHGSAKKIACPKRINYRGLCLCLGILFNGAVHATTIKEVSFTEATRQSELVFEGIVTSKYANVSTDTGQPFTYFTFQILDVMKGTYAEPTITLGYLGGIKDGYLLSVSDMRMPEIGERGIYFVESLSRRQVHPLYGWQQWHLLIYVDSADGVEKVRHIDDPSNGLAPDTSAAAAQSLEQFKRNIRSVSGQPR